MKTISVIMASYNGGQYIQEQIESVLTQVEVDVHLLVRDDGSSDNTQKILDKYQNDNKLKWYTGQHLNVAQGFLELLKVAEETEFYAFCDQDDIWKEDKLKAAIAMLENEDNTLPLMYYSATTLVDENLHFLKEHKIHINRTNIARFIINDISGNTIVINNKLRNLLCKIPKPDIDIHDKWCLQVCLATGGKCCGDPVPRILYRQHNNNTIGMELSIIDNVKKFFRIICMPHDKNFDVLKNNFYQELVEPYKSIVNLATSNSLPIKDRKMLLNDKNINYDNFFFNLAFKLRIFKGIL